MNPHDDKGSEARWESLLEQYREACALPEPGRNFLPGLWQRIDAKRSRTLRFEHAAKSLFAAAVAVSLLLGTFLLLPSQQPSAFNSGSFVEELASANAADSETFFEPVRMDLKITEQHRR